ncbi:MAG: hypothetical protein K9G33_13290 [Sneathiella sp.]|nr:hypothetical protein [Sneathiella sp.]
MKEQLVAALREALEDEYKARATYRKVIDTFGPVRPFINIVEAEDRHAAALLRQFARLGLEPPENTWTHRIETPVSLKAACKAAVAAEIENAAMYDRLLAVVDDPLVREVLKTCRTPRKTGTCPPSGAAWSG